RRGEQAAPRFGQCEDRTLCGDSDVAGQNQLHSTGHCETFDGGDERLRQGVVAEEALPTDAGVCPESIAVAVEAAAHGCLQISAGTELVSGARENGAGDAVV